MLNIELTENGLDITLKQINEDLTSALGRGISKAYKDKMIYKALGAISTLYNMAIVVDANEEDEQ